MTWYSSSAQGPISLLTSLTAKWSCWASSCLAVARRSRMLFFRLSTTAPQTALQLLLRGRQQEDRGCTGVHPADIGRAVHVDDQHHQLACVEALVDLFFQGTIVVAVIEVVLHYFIVLNELLELLPGAVVVIHTLLLPGTGRTGGGGDRLFDFRVGLPQGFDNAVLARTGCTRNYKQIFFIFHDFTAPLLSLFPPAARRHGWPPFPAARPKGRHGRNP